MLSQENNVTIDVTRIALQTKTQGNRATSFDDVEFSMGAHKSPDNK